MGWGTGITEAEAGTGVLDHRQRIHRVAQVPADGADVLIAQSVRGLRPQPEREPA